MHQVTTKLKITKDNSWLFSNSSAKKWLNTPNRRQPNAMLTSSLKTHAHTIGRDDFVWSTDPRYLRLTEDIAKLSDMFKADVKQNGCSGPSGVPSNFNAALNVSGIGMTPYAVPLMNNRKFADSLGLASDILPQHIYILEELVDLYFGHGVVGDAYIRREATTAIPYFTNDMEYKLESSMRILLNLDDFLTKAVSMDLLPLLNDYDVAIVSALMKREQPDSIKRSESGEYTVKTRPVATAAEARSGDFKGETFAKREVYDNAGNIIENHFAMRVRDVYAMNGVLNYVMTAIFTPFRNNFLNRFAFTYKVRNEEEKADRMRPFKYIMGMDVKTMDKLFLECFIDRVIDRASKYIDERVLILLKRMFTAPFVVRPTGEAVDEWDPLFGGNPLKGESFVNFPGLPSGISFNPDAGKLWMTFVYLAFYHDNGIISEKAHIAPLLLGKNGNNAMLDMSDDAVHGTNSFEQYMAFANPKSPYAVLEPESPVIYLGSVFMESGNRRYCVANINTYTTNTFAKESSIHNKPLHLIAEGHNARKLVYGSAPTFRDVHQYMVERIRHHLGFNIDTWANTVAKRNIVSVADAEFMLNPDIIIWGKRDPSEVDPHLVDKYVAKLHAKDFFPAIRGFYKIALNESALN